MTTPSDARAVKRLNKSTGRRRFVFKTFSQRIEEVDIDVYRSLDTLKAEPSGGSSFFRYCMIEYRAFAQIPDKREVTIFNLLSKYVKEPSAAESFVDILLPFLTKKCLNLGTCVHVLQIVGRVVTVLGSGSSKKILNFPHFLYQLIWLFVTIYVTSLMLSLQMILL